MQIFLVGSQNSKKIGLPLKAYANHNKKRICRSNGTIRLLYK